jgi:WD40 repeat protein
VEDDAPAPDRTRLALFGVAVGVVLLLVGGLGLALFLASGEKGRPVAQAAAPPERPAQPAGEVDRPSDEDGAVRPEEAAPITPPDPEDDRILPLPLPELHLPPPATSPASPADGPRVAAEELPPSLAPGERPMLVLDPGGHTARIAEVIFTPDGRQIVSVSADKTVRFWDAATGEALRVLRPPAGAWAEGGIATAAGSPDGTRLAVGGYPIGGGKLGWLVHIIALPEGRVERVLKGHRNFIDGLAFSPDGRRVVSTSADRTARVYDAQTGALLAELKGGDRLTQPAFSPDGKLIAAGSYDHTASVWQADGQGERRVLRGHPSTINCVAWSHDGARLASGGIGPNGSVRLWKPDGTAVAAYSLQTPKGVTNVMRLAFTPDDGTLLYAGLAPSGGQAGLIDVATGQYRLEIKGHDNSACAGALSPDGTLAATAGGDEMPVIVWKTADGSTVHRLQGGGRSV